MSRASAAVGNRLQSPTLEVDPSACVQSLACGVKLLGAPCVFFCPVSTSLALLLPKQERSTEHSTNERQAATNPHQALDNSTHWATAQSDLARLADLTGLVRYCDERRRARLAGP